ncbi:MAG: GGDEF domain-containing protein [Pleomorphochaeta sp.]
MLFIRKRYKSTLNDDDEFILYYLLFNIGGILMILRSVLPSLISIILANSLLIYAEILLLYGITKFYYMKIKIRYGIIGLILYTLAFIYFTYIEINVTARILVSVNSSVLIRLLIIICILKETKDSSKRSLMLPINILYFFYCMIRLLNVFIRKESSTDYMDYSYDAFIILLDGLLGLLTVIGIYDLIVNRFSQNIVDIEIKKNIELEKQTRTDNLTKLLNRNALFEDYQINDKLKGKIIYYIVLDKFKYINDNYGHSIGDKVLKTIANRLSEVAPETNIYRMGGDEFLIISPSISNNLGNDLLKIIKKPISYKNIETTLSASIEYLDTDDFENYDLTRVINFSDIAMFESKANGKNCIHKVSIDMLERLNNL